MTTATPRAPTTKTILAEAKAAGLEIARSGNLNGAPAYRVIDAAKHGMAANPFGHSAALLTIGDVARRLGYPV